MSRVIPIKREQDTTVSVNGVVISPEAIASEAQNHPMPKGKPGWAWRAAAHALVMREVLLQCAREKALTPQPEALMPGQWETDEEALIRQLLESELSPEPINEEALRKLYEQAPDKFRSPSLFEAAHILFPAPPEDPSFRAKARHEACGVLEQLQQQPGRFAALAQEHSACPSKDQGGLLGQLASGDTVPEFEAALATMPEGSISEAPVETRYGFHIIRLDARVRGAVLPFESVLPGLREAQEKAEWVKAGRRYMSALADQATITGIDVNDTPWTDPAQLASA